MSSEIIDGGSDPFLDKIELGVDDEEVGWSIDSETQDITEFATPSKTDIASDAAVDTVDAKVLRSAYAVGAFVMNIGVNSQQRTRQRH